MKKLIKLKKSTKQYIIVAALCVLVIGGTSTAAYVVMYGQLKDKYERIAEETSKEIEDNKHLTYVVIEPINKGEYITEEKLEYKNVFATQPQEVYFTAEDIGKIATIDLVQGIQLLKSMCSENSVEGNLREVSYDTILLNSNIINNDTVDIRIQYPNGENFIVLSKKNVKLSTEGREESFYWMTEEEILLMSSAIVDAYLYQGSVLYTAKYIEPTIQEPSYVTYTPSLANINLIKDNPNIVQVASNYLNEMVRKKLENRLSESMNVDIKEIDWSVDSSKTEVKSISSEPIVDSEGFVYYTEEEEDKENVNEYGE